MALHWQYINIKTYNMDRNGTHAENGTTWTYQDIPGTQKRQHVITRDGPNKGHNGPNKERKIQTESEFYYK